MLPKTTSNFKIVRLNGQVYDMHECGILVDKFIISSPSPKHTREEVDFTDGYIDQGTVYDGRVMKGEFIAVPYDFPDRPFLQNEVFRIFDSREAFYIIRDCEPGKRWLVKVESSFDIEPGVINRFSISFSSSSPYSESILSTMDDLSFRSDELQFDMGLIGDDVSYSHKTNSFRIYNAGDIAIDPGKLLFKDFAIEYRGASRNLAISNLTTNDKWTYTGTSAAGDVITLKGVQSLKNNISIFGETNRKLLTLAPGWNSLKLSGNIDQFTIFFDFRFRYL